MAEAGPPDRKAKKALIVRWLRRLSQLLLLGVFLFLVVRSAAPVSSTGGSPVTRLDGPVNLFFRADPLVALIALVASRRFYVALLPALVVVLITLVVGRSAVCGWGLCPLGTLNHLVSRLFRPRRRSERRRRNAGTGARRWKYSVLAAVLGCALLGSAAGGWVDPISIATRGVGLFLIPALNLAAGHPVEPPQMGNEGTLDGLSSAAATATSALTAFRRQQFQASWLMGGVFLAILAANAYRPRLWCRTLCPLGALLGLLSKLSLLGMRKNHEACIDCGRCEEDCQGADAPRGRQAWQESECVACLNCQASCPTGVHSFSILPPREAPGEGAVALDRRHLLGATLAGAALVPLARVEPRIDAARNPWLIRPPGALAERDFLARCVRCGQCMKACPTNAIQPALAEAGIEGVLTPVLIMRVGACEPSCVTCGQVCPTGAIRALTEEEKRGDGEEVEPVRLGTAFIDRGRCLPWAMATPCIVCEEFCPTAPKAIWVESAIVADRDGREVTLARPHVDPRRCTGCGACEYICPVQTTPAIRINAVGESRAAGHQILLSDDEPT